MAITDDRYVATCPGILIWDGITQPETDTYTGKLKYTVKIAIPANAPEKQELEYIANKRLTESKFKGVLPSNGKWPILSVDMTKFQEDAARLNGHVAINANTTLGAPEVFDANMNKLDPMQYRSLLYPGAMVKLLVAAYDYDNSGNKGIALSLDGIMIVDATAPKLSVAAGLSQDQKAAAFGMGRGHTAAPAYTPPAQTYAPPAIGVQPAHDFVNNAGMMTPPPPAEERYSYQGKTFTKAEALGWGWTEAQLAALPRA